MPATSSRLAAAAAALAIATLGTLAGCNDNLEVPGPEPIGLLLVDVDGDASPTSAIPTVTFIRAYGLSIADTRTAGDTCEVVAFKESTTPSTPIEGVDAGEAVSLRLSGTTTTLVPTASAVGREYAPAGKASVTFRPGDTATVTIPGAAGGFPAFTFAVRTAEPVAFDSVLVPDTDNASDVTVTWTAGEATSTMLLSLRYESPSESGIRQVLCIMRDDGTFIIPGGKLTGWRASTSVNRKAVATRVRSAGTGAGGDNTFYASSSFEKTVPIKTQQP